MSKYTKSKSAVLPTDPATLGYLAGLVDGEGTIAITSMKTKRNLSHALKIVVANTDFALMQWLYETFGGSICLMTRANAKHREAYRLEVYGENAVRVIAAICPYLRIKKAQAELALDFFSLNAKHSTRKGQRLTSDVVHSREQMKQQMHVLNRRGPA